MAVVGGEGDKANVTSKDLAAALTPDKGRAPVLNKEVANLRERYIKDQGKSVFQADMAQNPEDLMVNFDEMRRILDTERRRVDLETDKKKKDVLQKRYDRLELRYNVYDKLLNNEGMTAMAPPEQQELINTMAALPGFAEAASIAIGGRLSTEQMMKVLSGKGGILNPSEKKALSEMILTIANDDKFKNKVSKALSTLEMDKDDQTLAIQIDGLRDKLQSDINEEIGLDKYKRMAKTYESSHPDEVIEVAKAKFASVKSLLERIPVEHRPVTFDATEIENKKILLTNIKLNIKQNVRNIPDKFSNSGALLVPAHQDTDPFTPEQLAQIRDYDASISALDSLKTTASADAGGLTAYKGYADALDKIGSFNSTAAERSARLTELSQAESKRSKSVDKYKRKLEVTLSEEMKRYWNDVMLENGSKAAEAQAAIKGEEKEAADKLEVKRVEVAHDLLTRFTELSYLKYEGSEAKGWDDAALKQFVKKDLLSRSPKQLSRDILDRIIRNRGQLPRAYGKEIDAMLKDIGVGAGTPPATARDVLNAIDGKEYQKWASEKIPDLMGYARSRGYYFDKLNLKPAQAEFLLRAYDEKFFTDAADAKKKYLEQADKFMGGEFKDFITDGALNGKKVKEFLVGKDWTQGAKKLWKLMQVLGTAYFLGGGLSFGVGTTAQLHDGLRAVTDNLTALGGAAVGTAVTASRISNMALHGVVGNAAIATIPANGGAENAGGILEGLAKISKPGAILNSAANGPVTP